MKRLIPLPRIGFEPVEYLKLEYKKAGDKKQNTKPISRRLNVAVARQIRRELKQERKAS